MTSTLKIAIIGCRGIPNCYGGFEQLAEHLSEGLVKQGHAVSVYNSHKHSYKETTWRGVNIIHCYDAEPVLGTAGQFIYDFNCIRNARKQKFDVILFLGYTSSSIWRRLYPKTAVIISNMDGMEWQRNKYAKITKRFLRYAEQLAVRYSDFLIADSIGIQQYLLNKYKKESEYIAYGATVFTNEDDKALLKYGINKNEYYMLMARMEPENNIEMILDGFTASSTNKKFIVIGKMNNRFGKKIQNKFKENDRILFIGAAYDKNILHALKVYCTVYFHGHSVGGTNPSLLEAMASKALVAIHDNQFNKTITGTDCLLFNSSDDVKEIIEAPVNDNDRKRMIENNLEKITTNFNWSKIISQYDGLMQKCYLSKQ